VIVVDASVWVAVFVARDVYHASSDRWLSGWNIAGGTVIVPTLLIPEMAGAIARQTGDTGLVATVTGDLRDDPTVRFVALDVVLARDAATIAANLKLRGADAVYVALAQREDVPLVTWDREQLSRAKGVIAVATPDDAPRQP